MSRSSMKKKMTFQTEKLPDEDLMERFHCKKICTIIPTNPKKKPDPFTEYRPKTNRDCMNYNISQTDAKMDAGPTKIHVQQTRAEYEPYPDDHIFEEDVLPPSPKKRKRPSHGRGPVWLFLDEELKRKIDFEQEIYKREMEARLKRKIKRLKRQRKNEHELILKMSGPDWFQELSPDQLSCVDTLEECIRKDERRNTIINTQDCLARLGLVLRPNQRNVEKSMKYCCSNPVEFLLLLYQLTNPDRNSYSVNDRLLLSAVVHLTMRSILRELHIRIPSPPSHEPVKHKKAKPRKTHIKYKSPYLVPFTYEPEPPKHTGVYRNTHIQYPEHPYFSYLDELKEDMANAMTVSPVPGEGSNYFRDKMMQYGEGSTPKLNKVQREIDEELEIAQIKYDSLRGTKNRRPLLRPSVYRPCEKLMELFVLSNQRFSISSDDQSYEELMKCVESKASDECKCLQKQIDERIKERALERQREIELLEEEERKKRIQKEMECICEINIKSSCSSTNSNITVGSFAKRPIEEADEQEGEEKLLKVKEPAEFVCGCKEMVDITLECAQKRLECEADCNPRKTKPTLIIADTRLNETEGEDEEPVPIIAGIRAPKICDCLGKYRRTIAKYEELVEKQRAQETLKSCEKKFVINGVTIGKDGKPIYILSGLLPERPCKNCEEMLEGKKREEERIANMPDRSQFQHKYVISGVYNSPAGNAYVLAGVVPTPDCKCMRVYKSYMREHGHCMDVYEKYLQKMKDDTKEYLAELGLDENEFQNIAERQPDTQNVVQDILAANIGNDLNGELDDLEGACLNCNDEVVNNVGDVQEEEVEEKVNQVKAEVEKLEEKEDDSFSCICTGKEAEEEINISDENLTEECICRKGPKPAPLKEIVDMDIKRFILLEKIPCDKKTQRIILKAALSSLANDGYPLAKLPEAYKLPHFKLWMALRCGKYWTQEDRVTLYFASKDDWAHLDHCATIHRSPRLNMSNEKAHTLTWASAGYVKRITQRVIERHCRNVKRGIIDDGREFFKSMYDYELPTKTFRDCYFAYIPSKEEAVFSYRPWKVYEYIDYKLIRIKKGE